MPYYQSHNYLEVKNQLTVKGIIRIIPQKINININNYTTIFHTNSGVVVIDINEQNPDNKEQLKNAVIKLKLPEIKESQDVKIVNLSKITKVDIEVYNTNEESILDDKETNKTKLQIGEGTAASLISVGKKWSNF